MGDVLSFRAQPRIKLQRTGDHWDLTVEPSQEDAPTLMRFARQHEAIAWGCALHRDRGWRFLCWDYLSSDGSAA